MKKKKVLFHGINVEEAIRRCTAVSKREGGVGGPSLKLSRGPALDSYFFTRP